jgi:hypothetical protein
MLDMNVPDLMKKRGLFVSSATLLLATPHLHDIGSQTLPSDVEEVVIVRHT